MTLLCALAAFLLSPTAVVAVCDEMECEYKGDDDIIDVTISGTTVTFDWQTNNRVTSYGTVYDDCIGSVHFSDHGGGRTFTMEYENGVLYFDGRSSGNFWEQVTTTTTMTTNTTTTLNETTADLQEELVGPLLYAVLGSSLAFCGCLVIIVFLLHLQRRKMEEKSARSIQHEDRFPSPFVEAKGDLEREAVVPSEGGLNVLVPATSQIAAVSWSSATNSVIENEFCIENNEDGTVI